MGATNHTHKRMNPTIAAVSILLLCAFGPATTVTAIEVPPELQQALLSLTEDLAKLTLVPFLKAAAKAVAREGSLSHPAISFEEEDFAGWDLTISGLTATNSFQVHVVELGANNRIFLELAGPSEAAILVEANNGVMAIEAEVLFHSDTFRVLYDVVGYGSFPAVTKIVLEDLNIAKLLLTLVTDIKAPAASTTIINIYNLMEAELDIFMGVHMQLRFSNLAVFVGLGQGLSEADVLRQGIAVGFPLASISDSDGRAYYHTITVNQETAHFDAQLIGSIIVKGVDKGFSLREFKLDRNSATNAITCKPENVKGVNLLVEDQARAKVLDLHELGQVHSKGRSKVRGATNWLLSISGVTNFVGSQASHYFLCPSLVTYLGFLFSIVGEQPPRTLPTQPAVEPSQSIQKFTFTNTAVTAVSMLKDKISVTATTNTVESKLYPTGDERDDSASTETIVFSHAGGDPFISVTVDFQENAFSGTRDVGLRIHEREFNVHFTKRAVVQDERNGPITTTSQMRIDVRIPAELEVSFNRAIVSILLVKIPNNLKLKISEASGSFGLLSGLKVKTSNELSLQAVKVHHEAGGDVEESHMGGVQLGLAGLTLKWKGGVAKFVKSDDQSALRQVTQKIKLFARSAKAVNQTAGQQEDMSGLAWEYLPGTSVLKHRLGKKDKTLYDTLGAHPTADKCRWVAKTTGPFFQTSGTFAIVETVLVGGLRFVLRWVLGKYAHESTFGKSKDLYDILCKVLANQVYPAL